MINWREGKAGFIGASKRLIKGFFSYQYSLALPPIAPSTEGPSIVILIDELGHPP